MKWMLKILLIGVVTACGTNQFATIEKKDAAEDAAIQLEKGNAQKAINILEKALEDDPNNPVLISLLSEAYAELVKIGVLDIAMAMAESEDDAKEKETEAKSDIAILWPFLPEPTDKALISADYAVFLLNSIAIEDRTLADNFKLALLSIASVSLRAKAFDANGDGVLSTQEVLTMTSDDALAIIHGIAGASSAVLLGSSKGKNAEKAAKRITKIANDLDASEGDTPEEQLANYFNTH